MYLEVYPDIIFILNFSFDLILLYLLKKINRRDSKRRRLILAAAVGGMVAVVAGILPWLPNIVKICLLAVIGAFLMIRVAFGPLKTIEFLKQWVVLNILTYFVGGFLNSIYYQLKLRVQYIEMGNGITFSTLSWKIVGLCIIVMIPIVLLVQRVYREQKGAIPITYSVELVYDSQIVHAKGLMDTGNGLYDPLYSCPVIVIEQSLITQLFTSEFRQEIEETICFLDGGQFDISQWKLSDASIGKIRMIPYRSVGKCGMLVGVQLDKLLIHTDRETICTEKVTAAISNTVLSNQKDYQVILHKALL